MLSYYVLRVVLISALAGLVPLTIALLRHTPLTIRLGVEIVLGPVLVTGIIAAIVYGLA